MTDLSQFSPIPTIQSTIVPQNRKLPILPSYFPSTFLMLENAVYELTDKLCASYSGEWQCYELSNGGFYMSLDTQGLYDVSVPFGNGFEGQLSADALGITVCIYVYSYLAEKFPAANFVDHYWHLRNFAYEHKEVASILKAISESH